MDTQKASKIDFNLVRLIQPVDGPVTQRFGERPDWDPNFYLQWGYPGHNGQDYGVSQGTPIKAAAGGDVDKIGFEAGGYGRFLRLKHAGGLFYTYYAHCQQIVAEVGDHVEAGDLVAYSGNTGSSTGPHLHFELRVPSDPVPGYKSGARNPEPFFVAVDASSPAIPSAPKGGGKKGGQLAVNVAGANVRTAPMGAVVGVAQYGTRFTSAGDADGEWQPVICYIHKTLLQTG